MDILTDPDRAVLTLPVVAIAVALQPLTVVAGRFDRKPTDDGDLPVPAIRPYSRLDER